MDASQDGFKDFSFPSVQKQFPTQKFPFSNFPRRSLINGKRSQDF